jgi:flagellar protein FlgJ
MSDISKLPGMTGRSGIELSKPIELKKETQVSNEKLREVADLYEKHFIKEMMKQMKSTLPEGGLIKKNNAEHIFQDQLDEQYSAEWNKRGGFGISDMIFQQLTEKFGAKEAGLEKPVGPIEFKEKSKIEKVPGTLDQTYQIFPASIKDATSEFKNIDVTSPWAGTLQNKNVMENNQMSYRIKHDNGLESLILIQGGPTEETRHLSQGDQIRAGDTIGKAKETSPLFWTIKKTVS